MVVIFSDIYTIHQNNKTKVAKWNMWWT